MKNPNFQDDTAKPTDLVSAFATISETLISITETIAGANFPFCILENNRGLDINREDADYIEALQEHCYH